MSLMWTALKKYSNLPHSVMIAGGNQEIRKTEAYEAAMELLCKGADAPCGVCDQCLKIKAGSHPDFFYVSEQGVKADTAREIRKNAYIRPNEAEFKIFAVECDDMTVQAQNALLKVIEEPQNARFLLLCTNEHNLLQTIRSRCALMSLSTLQESPVPDEKLAALAADFGQAVDLDELALYRVMTAASALNREEFRSFTLLCQQELRNRMLLGNTPRYLALYDTISSLQEDLIYNPGIFGAAMALCANCGKNN